MNLIFWLLHLSEGLSKYNISCTACINQDIVDQKSFDNTRDNHGIVVWVILELKVLLRPYESQKAKLVVREMTDLLVLDLVDKGLVTDQMVLTECVPPEFMTILYILSSGRAESGTD